MLTYKAIAKNMISRYGNIKYQVGELYTFEGDLILGQQGLHSSYNPKTCMKYVDIDNFRLFECYVKGEHKTDNVDVASKSLLIVREIFVEGLVENIDNACSKAYFKKGILHNEDEPTIVTKFDDDLNHVLHLWYTNGKLHRDNALPSVKEYNGYGKLLAEKWCKNGRYHRDTGPAIVSELGEYWYKNGKLHRDVGPAVILYNGVKHWYKDGILIYDYKLPASLIEQWNTGFEEHMDLGHSFMSDDYLYSDYEFDNDFHQGFDEYMRPESLEQTLDNFFC